MKKFALLALATAIALPASAAGVTIGGYIDVGWFDVQGGNSLNAANRQGQAAGATYGGVIPGPTFSLNEVNIDVSAQLTNDISAFASIDFNPTDRAIGTAVAGAIDYAYVDIANPGPFDLNIRAGRIPSVIGIEQRTSESPQTRFVNLSLLSRLTVGSIEGAAIYGSFSPVNYALAISNADNLSSTGVSIRGLGGGAGVGAGMPFGPSNNNGSAKAVGLDGNNDKAISGRLGVVPIEGLEVGVSGSLDRYPTAAGNFAVPAINQNAARKTFAADASYTFGAFGLKGEYITVTEEQPGTVAGGATSPDASARGFYAEGTWDINSKYAVGVRYNKMKIQQEGAAGAGFSDNKTISDYSTWQIAGVYHVADNVHLKAEYDLNREAVLNRFSTRGAVTNGTRTYEFDNDVIALSLVGAF